MDEAGGARGSGGAALEATACEYDGGGVDWWCSCGCWTVFLLAQAVS